MHLSPLDLALASVVVMVGATVQGSVGFGLNVIAAPLLVLIDTAFIPGPALASAFVLTILMARREQHGIDTTGLGWIFAARVPASIGTALVVASLPERNLAIALSSAVLVAVVLNMLGLRVRRRPLTLAAAGAASGVLGTISSVGGPPIALLYQDDSGPTIRSTMAVIFAFGTTTSILLLALVGRFGMNELALSLVLTPGVCIGFVVSRWTGHLLDRGFVRPAVLGLSAASAIAAIVHYA